MDSRHGFPLGEQRPRKEQPRRILWKIPTSNWLNLSHARFGCPANSRICPGRKSRLLCNKAKTQEPARTQNLKRTMPKQNLAEIHLCASPGVCYLNEHEIRV